VSHYGYLYCIGRVIRHCYPYLFIEVWFSDMLGMCFFEAQAAFYWGKEFENNNWHYIDK
jgi:hypothetical protein